MLSAQTVIQAACLMQSKKPKSFQWLKSHCLLCSTRFAPNTCASSLPTLFQLQGISPKGTNRFLLADPSSHLISFCLNALPSDSPHGYSFPAFKSPTSLLSELYPGHSDELILFKTRSCTLRHSQSPLTSLRISDSIYFTGFIT